jgi:hypothetical protein
MEGWKAMAEQESWLKGQIYYILLINIIIYKKMS